MPETRRRNIKYSISSQKTGARPGSSRPSTSKSGSTRPGGAPSSKASSPRVAGGIPSSVPLTRNASEEINEDNPESASQSANFVNNDITPEFMGGGPTNSDKDLPRTIQPDSDIENNEANPDAVDGNKTATTEKEDLLNDSDDNLYNPEGGKGTLIARIAKSKTTQKWILGGGGLFAVIGILANVFFPSFLMTHISDMILDGPASQLSSQHMIQYRRNNISRVRDIFSRDGRRGGAVIAQMERKGYIFTFDSVDRNRITGIGRIGSNVATPNINGAADRLISDFIDREHPILSRSAKWKSAKMNAFYNRYKISRTSVVKDTTTSLPDSIEEINRRIKGVVDGNENAIDTPTRADIAEGATEEERARLAAAETVSRGDTDLLAEANEKLKQGIRIEDMLPEERAILEAPQGISEALIDSAQKSITLRSGFGRLASGIGSMFDVTDVPDTLCTINRRIRTVTAIARATASIQLMRYGYAFVSADDAQRKGEASSKFVGALMARVTASDNLGSYFGSSSGYSYATKGTFSKAKNSTYKSSVTVDGKPSGWLAWMQDASSIPGCSVWQNPVARIGINIGIAVVSVFTGGTAGGAAASIRTVAVGAVRQMFTLRGLGQLAIGAAGGLSLEGVALLVQIYAQKKQDIPFSTQEEGGELSMIAAASGGVMNKHRGLQAGQVPATVEQYAQARTEYLAEKKKQLSEKSFMARMFDITDKDSLAYTTTAKVALNYGGAAVGVENTTSAIASAPSIVLSSVASVFSPFIPKSGAQDGDEVAFDSYTTVGDNPVTLATGVAGELLPIMREDIASIDPVENRAALLDPANGGPYIDATTEEPLGLFASHVENCVENPDTLTILDDNAAPTDPAYDCLALQPLTRRFKAHLAYLDMLDVLDGALFPNESAEDSGTTSGNPAPQGGAAAPIVAEGLNGYVIPCQGIQRSVIRSGGDAANWSNVPDSGTIGINSSGQPMKVYIRDACAGQTDVKTVVIVGSIHGSENGGQLVAHELLFNETLPPNVRIVAIPEYCNCAGTGRRATTGSPPIDLNRNNNYRWNDVALTQVISGTTYARGPSPASQPETQAMNRFLLSIGRANLSLHYHDSLNYVAAVDARDTPFARVYAAAAGNMRVGNDNGTTVSQPGSLDGWYFQETGTPAILVEMGSSQSDSVIRQHVNGVLAVINGANF